MEFNLVNDPWIKVLTQDQETKIVSMVELLKNAKKYIRIAGDMPTQDVIVLRFLLATLTTVYSRVNADGEPYEWLKLSSDWQIDSFENKNEIPDDLLETWKNLYENCDFSAAITYLSSNVSKFDFDKLYQVDFDTFNSLAKKNISIGKKTSTVNIRQINRTISESNNSPAIFSPKSEQQKDKINPDELVRWILMYENIAGVTDKNKACSNSVSTGWYYNLRPIYAKGNNVFETLMLNLVLNNYKDGYRAERPVWEFEDVKHYVEFITSQPDPTELTISTLYTLGARMFHIEWEEAQPTIYTAGLPSFPNKEVFNEPMAIFSKNSDGEYISRPLKLSQINRSLWLDLDNILAKTHAPGIISWLRDLISSNLIKDNSISLESTSLISDGKSSSQLPEGQYDVSLELPVERLTSPESTFKAVELCKKLSTNYWYLIKDISDLRGLPTDKSKIIVNRKAIDFNDQISREFDNWIRNSNTTLKNLKVKIQPIFEDAGNDLLRNASLRDIAGKEDENGELTNIFKLHNKYRIIGLKYLKSFE